MGVPSPAGLFNDGVKDLANETSPPGSTIQIPPPQANAGTYVNVGYDGPSELGFVGMLEALSHDPLGFESTFDTPVHVIVESSISADSNDIFRLSIAPDQAGLLLTAMNWGDGSGEDFGNGRSVPFFGNRNNLYAHRFSTPGTYNAQLLVVRDHAFEVHTYVIDVSAAGSGSSIDPITVVVDPGEYAPGPGATYSYTGPPQLTPLPLD